MKKVLVTGQNVITLNLKINMTREQIIQVFKNKLTTNDPKAVLVINLKKPIYLLYSQQNITLRIRITLISYEKETDTVWLLGKDTLGQFIKISIETALDQGLPSTYNALENLAKEIDTMTTTPLEIKQKTITN